MDSGGEAGFSAANYSGLGMTGNNPVQDMQQVGEGKEFKVLRPANKGNIVYKVPKEPHAWADPSVSICTYQERMCNRLRTIDTGFGKYLPTPYERTTLDGLGEVIESEDISEAGANLVIALEQLDVMENGTYPQLTEAFKKYPVSEEQFDSVRQEVRADLLGTPSSGGGLLDRANLQHVIIPPDTYLIVIKPNGTIRVVMADFGTVVERNDLSDDTIIDQASGSAVSILSKLGNLKYAYSKLDTPPEE